MNKVECPNYYISVFYPMNGEPYQVEDCAPVRTMLMIKELYSNLIGVQKSFEQQRNNMDRILEPVRVLTSYIEMKKNDTKLLSEEENRREQA